MDKRECTITVDYTPRRWKKLKPIKHVYHGRDVDECEDAMEAWELYYERSSKKKLPVSVLYERVIHEYYY